MNPKPAPPAVVVFGSLNMDLVLRVPRAPGPGETLTAHGLATHPGGKGANQAVACARQGACVAMAGRVGDDAYGAALRLALQADAIDIEQVRVSAGVPTGVALVMVDDAGQNRICVVPGANALVSQADAQALVPLLATAKVLMLQCEVPIEAVRQAAELARAAGCRVALTPAPARPLPAALWRAIDVLLLNESEASLLAGFDVTDRASAGAAARALSKRGPGCVILTRGAAGLVIDDGHGVREHAALQVEAVDTTAAGDTFAGTLCAALAGGESTDRAVARAIEAAAVCVTRAGAQASIPRRGERPAPG